MTDLLHRVKVFVFTLGVAQPSYLLVRSAQGQEGFWGPIQGNLGYGEGLDHAIRREVLDDLGLARSSEVIDLQMPTRWSLGDEEVIEWNYGFRAAGGEETLRLDPRWSEFRWVGFPLAYPSLELDSDRAAITRLHTLLRG